MALKFQMKMSKFIKPYPQHRKNNGSHLSIGHIQEDRASIHWSCFDNSLECKHSHNYPLTAKLHTPNNVHRHYNGCNRRYIPCKPRQDHKIHQGKH